MVEKKLSPKQEQIRDRNEKIKVLYEEGLSYKDIMSSVGVKKGYVDGLSYSDIAVSVGKSESFVEKHIKENLEGTSLESIRKKNIIARYKAVNKDSIYDLIRKYYEMGLSLKEICAKVERGRTIVINCFCSKMTLNFVFKKN